MKIRLTDKHDPDYGNCSVCGSWCRGQRAELGIGPLSCEVVVCFDCATAHGGTQDVVAALSHLLRREDPGLGIEITAPGDE